MIRKQVGKLIVMCAMMLIVSTLNGCSNTNLVNTQTVDLDAIEGINISYTSENITIYESEGQQLTIQ